MKPISFPQQNATFAKDQPQYIPLPAYKDQGGRVVSCWKGRLWERLVFLFTGRIWLVQLTYGTPLQPMCASVLSPFPHEQTGPPQ